jgi:uncharacterized protein (DUF2126 family)
LHPTIPIHAPLFFSLIDSLTHRSIGQCTYHVGPPNGSLYAGRPVSACEAEERRSQRFTVSAPAPGLTDVPAEEVNPLFPMTLDLRLPARSRDKNNSTAGLVS